MLKKIKLIFLTIPFLIIIQVNASPKEKIISLNAISGLQYDQVRFSVMPGEEVKIVFTNNDDMDHNLVFTEPESREEIVDAALRLGAEGPERDFVPGSPKVLFYIPVLSPGQTESISLRAPEIPGVYPYVCTYPGHGFIMFGAMYVTNEAMPAIEMDLNIPPNRRMDEDSNNKQVGSHSEHAKMLNHPYKLVEPYLYRVFISDATPAAIAVRLPQELSYCWDAGTCYLRFAWKGGFLDHSDLWEGHKDAFVKILGPVFFRDKTEFPFRIEEIDNIPNVKFKGYRLINRFPEFHFLINGIDIYELILPKSDGTGLIRAFRIPKSNKTIWFTTNSQDGVEYESSKGRWENGSLKLSSSEAKEFTITMTIKEGVQL